MKARLVLFDIDGTLLDGGPVWRDCFEQAVGELFPGSTLSGVSFGGKTDHQICRELFQVNGIEVADPTEAGERLLNRYLELASSVIPNRAHDVRVLPGVRELLGALSASQTQASLVVSLLTGNIRPGAWMKLKAVGLEQYFNFDVGAFGCDHWNRYELPRIAVERATQHLAAPVSGKQVVIIGDTVHDVQCGKSIGVKSIAVGTGRRVSREELMKAGPDFYFTDFAETGRVVSAILE